MTRLKQLISFDRFNYKGAQTREEARKLPTQTGALPWRWGRNKRLEVLLVTGRRSHRWMIPKGWPMAGKTLAEAAAQEAFEEAGVKGKIDPEPIGSFSHTKQSLPTGTLEVNILVHSLCVERELSKWPEAGQRRRKWFSIEDAAGKVDSDELKMVMAFAEQALVHPKRKSA